MSDVCASNGISYFSFERCRATRVSTARRRAVPGRTLHGAGARSEEGLRGDEGGSREFCHDTKEAVHEPVNDSRAKALQAGVRDLEVRHEPAGAGSGGFLQTIDHCGKLIRRKAIEEKMCRDQIVAFGGRIPCRKLGADEFHTIERQRRMEQAFSGNLEPSTAQPHAHRGRATVRPSAEVGSSPRAAGRPRCKWWKQGWFVSMPRMLRWTP